MRPKRVLVMPVWRVSAIWRSRIVFHAAITLEIFGDEMRGLFLVNAELLSEAESREAVNHAEIDDLSHAAMLGGLREGRDIENFLRGARVNVLSATEGLNEDRVAGQMREDAQLDLRIIRRKKLVTRGGDERGANLAAKFRANGNILQIWIGGAEAARRGAGLREARMQAAGDGMDQAGQHVGISGFEFGELAIFDDFLGQLVHGCEFFENVGGRGARFGATAARRLQLEFVEEDFGELLRRIDIEFHSGVTVDRFFQLADFFERGGGNAIQLDGIHADSRSFHARENGGERQINFFVEVQQALSFDFGAKDRRDTQQKIGAFPGCAGQRAIQMAQHHLGEFVVRGGRAQKIGIARRSTSLITAVFWCSTRPATSEGSCRSAIKA